MNAALAHVDSRTWRRFTPRQRIARFTVYFAIVAAIVASARTVEVIPEFLYDAPEQVKDLLTRMWPIAWSHYPAGVHGALMETLHIATLGTLLSILLAAPIALLGARNITRSRLLNLVATFIFVSSRSVNSLIWALLFVAIFGPGGQEVLFTGNAGQDAANLRGFVDGYRRMNRWEKIKAGGQVLYVGADNSVFPVPLGQNSAGRWYFDTAAGKDEIRARRIGKNELTAIAACEALANAQKRYFSQTHERGRASHYADKLVSDPGKENGLYWPAAKGRAASPLGGLGDFTKAVASNTGDHPPLFNGYYYRVLAKPGDFAILAYPAEYRNSGIMTFIVGKDGAIYQKDLGEKTREIALPLTEVDPADGWSPVLPHNGAAAGAQ